MSENVKKSYVVMGHFDTMTPEEALNRSNYVDARSLEVFWVDPNSQNSHYRMGAKQFASEEEAKAEMETWKSNPYLKGFAFAVVDENNNVVAKASNSMPSFREMTDEMRKTRRFKL